jgi:hypothetical protein
MKKKIFALTALALFTACTEKPQTAEDSAVAARSKIDSIVGQDRVVTPEGDSAVAPRPRDTATVEDRPAGDWQVSYAGIGSIKAGMGLDELKIVTRDGYRIPAKLEECDYIRPKTGPQGVALMIIKGEVARVDITKGTTATVEGAKIGDTEARIKELYGDRVKVMPHKYTSGHYLVVTPSASSNNRIVFETDGNKVLRYRSGREPEVEYVESCA